MQVRDALQTHAVGVLGVWLQRAWRDGWLRFDTQDGQRVWSAEVTQLMARCGATWVQAQDVALDHAQIPGARVPQTHGFGIDLRDALGDAAMAEDVHAEAWLDLIERLSLGVYELQVLGLLVAAHMDLALARLLRFAAADTTQRGLTWGLAVKLLADQPDMVARASAALDPERCALFGAKLVSLEGAHTTPLAERRLVLDDLVARALMGWPSAHAERVTLEDAPMPPKRLAATLRKRLRRALGEQSGATRAAVYGPPGSGRLAVAAQIAQGVGARGGLWTLDLSREVAHRRGVERIAQACAAAVALDAAVVVRDLERLGDKQRVWIEQVEEAFARCPQALVWIFDAEPPEHLNVPPAAVVGLGYPSRAQRQAAWTAHTGGALAAEHIQQLAGQFLLAEGQIAQVAQDARAADPDARGDALVDGIITRAREAAQVGLGRLATPEPARVQMEQLIVVPETDLALNELISYTRNRHTLAQDWGFARQMPYGLGVTALFAGPPGTGKTFAAQAIATALGLELYRVDLSQLVSKYIGETEKHLAQLFASAEQGQVMLLFDEADSLFAKRTEVKSSVDRYANLEVNFLLQRIERFTGVVVLTTNFEAGLDDAFARRIRFRVPFDAPDAKARRRLWRALLPPEVPLASNVDFNELAEVYDLSGGHIKEIILRAAAIALNHPDPKRRVVTQQVIRRSADVEFKKLGRLPVYT